MKLFLPFCYLFIFINSFSVVGQSTSLNERNKILQIESHILKKNKDSALVILKNNPKILTTDYGFLLKEIASVEKLPYEVYYNFTLRVSSRPKFDYELISDYINSEISMPEGQVIDLDYVYLKWRQIGKIRDELTIELASEEQSKLESYVAQFDKEDKNVIKASLLLETHDYVLAQIKEEIGVAQSKCEKAIRVARLFNDPLLEAILKYHYSDFLVIRKFLNEYIKEGEEILLLESSIDKTFPYHVDVVVNLVNAYIFKGDNNDRVFQLLSEIYKNEDTRAQSYSLYAQLLHSLPENSIIKDGILQKFEVNSVSEFAEKITDLGEKQLNDKDFFYVVNECSNALFADQQYEEAMDYSKRAVFLTRKTYSRDLATSLASAETREELRAKESELEFEKQKKSLYFIIAVLVLASFLISLYSLLKSKKQTKMLDIKNQQIEKALNEKELLIKEVHHRVKNNFQIVSSLLELQIKGIEDNKALELAQEGKNRIQSMALIHEKLYKNENFVIDFDDFVFSLIKDISDVYENGANPVLDIKVPSVQFNLDTAVPLGLIINEIVTNAYKYSFANDTPMLHISMHRIGTGNYELIISDNGPGLPNHITFEQSSSLGLRLVKRLSEQLKGAARYNFDNGAVFSIRFQEVANL